MQASPEDLLAVIASTKFRRSALDPESRLDIEGKVRKAIVEGCPLEFTVPFGAYKNWRLPTGPGIDWAEVFNLDYLSSFASRIWARHPPGVIVSYTFSSELMALVSNLRPAWIHQYRIGFEALVACANACLPEGMSFHLVDINSLYPSEEAFRSEYDSNLVSVEREWVDGLLVEEFMNGKLASAERNLCPSGQADLSPCSPLEWKSLVRQAAIRCEALDRMSKRRAFNKQSDRIQLVFVRGPSRSLHVGCNIVSARHFWASAGGAEIRGGKALPIAIGPEMLANGSFTACEPEATESLPICARPAALYIKHVT